MRDVKTVPRFWSSHEIQPEFDELGFLAEPGGKGHALPWEAIEYHQCLVLLGEPGSGKSTALELAASAQVGTYLVDLGAVADASDLRWRLTEARPAAEWQAGEGELVLLLDALDEALVDNSRLARSLIEVLRSLPLERLRLRVACRASDWQPMLEDLLADAFARRPAVWELLPLRQQDVLAIAESFGVDVETFAQAVVAKDVTALARAPLTLRFLLEGFRQSGGFPADRRTLLLDGCLALCREHNLSRIQTKRQGSLSAEQRLVVAERIAAASVLGGRPTIVTGPASADSEEDLSLTLAQLEGGEERVDDLTALPLYVAVTRDSLAEVLDCGLFHSVGAGQRALAHRTYGEFLAARYLHRGGLAVQRLLPLLTIDQAGRRQTVPQLRGVAGWLASLNVPFLEWLIENDPAVVLGGDVPVSPGVRRQLVDALLDGAANGLVGPVRRGALRGLRHHGLAAQLDATMSRDADLARRTVAVGVAGQSGDPSLYQLLADLVVDPSEDFSLRCEAATASFEEAPEETRARLRPIALERPDEDPNGDLQGLALWHLWPVTVTFDEVLSAIVAEESEGSFLARPQRPRMQTYSEFVTDRFIPSLSCEQVVSALETIVAASNARRVKLHNLLVDRLLVAAWEQMDAPRVADAIAQTIVLELATRGARHFDESLEQAMLSDTRKRRAVVERLVPSIASETFDATHLRTVDLIRRSDLLWLVERAATAVADELIRAWARLAYLVSWDPHPSERAAISALRTASDHAAQVIPASVVEPPSAAEATPVHPDPGTSDRRQTAPVTPDWILAELQRAADEREAKEVARDAEELPSLVAALNAAESTDNGFLVVDQVLRTAFRGDGVGDITASRAWRAADETLRARIVTLARHYLERAPANTDYAAVGYRALRLMGTEAANVLSQLVVERAVLLAGELLRQRDGYSSDREGAGGMLEVAATVIPEAVSDAVFKLAEATTAAGGRLWGLGRELECVAVGPLDDAIARGVSALSSDDVAADVLDALLMRGSAESIATALALIEAHARLAAPVAALVVAHVRESAALDRVVSAMEGDSAMARTAIEWFAGYGARFNHRLASLPEAVAARLYRLGVREFPEYVEISGWHVGTWLRCLLGRLQHGRTVAAVRAIDWLVEQLPELPWLRGVAAEAREHALLAGWQPPAPEDVIRVVNGFARRVIRNGEHLLQATLEALESVQSDLDSEHSGAAELWHRQGGTLYEPVSEPELSSWLQRRLMEKLSGRGVILNREVQVSHPAHAALGRRTDIHINKSVSGTGDLLTTILETKACWSGQLGVGLSEQLVGQYLLGTGNRHGIYVVAWFDPTLWRDEDRKAVCARRDRESEMRNLASSAGTLEARDRLRVVVFALSIRAPS